MSEKLERFGKYLILDHLVDGGMAKICRARYLGEQADKVVAIKMVQPQYSSDAAFKKMFMDEIKVAFGLIHPNVVQTYDYGLHNNQLYVALEYCDGKNLKEYLDKLKEKKFVFPVEISVYIITQACQGLHYAHTLTDKLTGQSLNIIHRDISPHNIMLTYDGAVKIIDFGIAKADTNSEATQAGTIKGKLSYLAPEYLDGMTLDSRYDEFAIGITLWEMLCSRKLFKAPNDLSVLKKIQECKVPPPSSINPNVPKDLDDIVMKSLSKDRNKRYENMEMLNRALIKFLYAHYPDFNATDLSYFAKELFKEEIKKDREKFFAFGKVDIKPYLDELKREVEKGSKGDKTATGPHDSHGHHGGKTEAKKENVLDFGFNEEEIKKVKTGKNKEAIEKDLSAKDANSGAGNTLKIDLAKKNKRKDPLTAQRTSSKVTTKKTMEKTRTTILQTRKKNNKQMIMIGVALLGIILLSQFSEISAKFKSILGEEERGPASTLGTVTDGTPVKKEKAKRGKLIIKNYDKLKHKVYYNGNEKEVSLLGELDVPYASGTLRVQQDGRVHFIMKTNVSKESPVQKIVIPEMAEQAYGYLTMSSACLEGSVTFSIFEESRTENLPLGRGGIAFPVGNGHVIYVQVKNETIHRKVEFNIGHVDDAVDLCTLVTL